MDVFSMFSVEHQALRKYKHGKIKAEIWLEMMQEIVERNHKGTVVFFGPHDYNDFQRLLFADYHLPKIDALWNTIKASQALIFVHGPQGNPSFWLEDSEYVGECGITMVTRAKIQQIECCKEQELQKFYERKIREMSVMKQVYSITAHWKGEYDNVSSISNCHAGPDDCIGFPNRITERLQAFRGKPAARRRNRWAAG